MFVCTSKFISLFKLAKQIYIELRFYFFKHFMLHSADTYFGCLSVLGKSLSLDSQPVSFPSMTNHCYFMYFKQHCWVHKYYWRYYFVGWLRLSSMWKIVLFKSFSTWILFIPAYFVFINNLLYRFYLFQLIMMLQIFHFSSDLVVSIFITLQAPCYFWGIYILSPLLSQGISVMIALLRIWKVFYFHFRCLRLRYCYVSQRFYFSNKTLLLLIHIYESLFSPICPVPYPIGQ